MKIFFEKEVCSLEETKNLASSLAKFFPYPTRFYLDGDLGAGKTSFSMFFLESLGIKELQGSPTYTLMNEYFLEDARLLRHYDLYRLTEEDLLQIGFLEMLEEKVGALVEWAENVRSLLPEEAVSIYIRKDPNDVFSEKRIFQFVLSASLLGEQSEAFARMLKTVKKSL